MSFKAKNFLLTLFNIDSYADLSKYLHHFKSLNYLVSAKEKCPETGRIHIHTYVQFTGCIQLKAEKCYTAHIDRMKGTPQQCDAYVRKDGDIIEEYGQFRKVGGQTIKDVKAMTKEDREDLGVQYYNIVNKINQFESNKLNAKTAYKQMTVLYFWGPSGCGKTRSAMEYIAEHGGEYDEVKFVNGFWNGIGECDIALYDDFRDSHMKPSEFINFIDYYVHNLNIKGGNVKNHYHTILITSIQDPDYLWPKTMEESKVQWMRRMKSIDVSKSPQLSQSKELGDRSANPEGEHDAKSSGGVQ